MPPTQQKRVESLLTKSAAQIVGYLSHLLPYRWILEQCDKLVDESCDLLVLRRRSALTRNLSVNDRLLHTCSAG